MLSRSAASPSRPPARSPRKPSLPARSCSAGCHGMGAPVAEVLASTPQGRPAYPAGWTPCLIFVLPSTSRHGGPYPRGPSLGRRAAREQLADRRPTRRRPLATACGDSRGSPRDSRAAPRQAPSATGQVARASALLAWAAATDVEACRAARDGCRDARVEGGRVERGATPPRGTAETPSNPRHEAPVKASVWLRWRWSG